MKNDIKFQNVTIWIQAESTQKKDIVIVDDMVINEEDERYHEYSRYVSNIGNNYKEIAIFENTSTYMIPNVGILIMSHLTNTDSVGRRRAFSAIIKGRGLRQCINTLSKTLSNFGLQYDNNESDKIETYKKRQEHKKKILITCLSTIVLSIGLLILLKAL